jgi:hypothetical protein
MAARIGCPRPPSLSRQDAKGIAIRGYCADLHRLAAVVDDVDVETFPAEIQANVQHMTGPPVVLVLNAIVEAFFMAFEYRRVFLAEPPYPNRSLFEPARPRDQRANVPASLGIRRGRSGSQPHQRSSGALRGRKLLAELSTLRFVEERRNVRGPRPSSSTCGVDASVGPCEVDSECC